MTEFRKEETCVCCEDKCNECDCEELEKEINEEKDTGIFE